MSLSERMEAAEPFFRLAREVINPVDGERPWHADSKDWMVVFSFAGHSLTLGDLRRAAGQDGSAEGDGGAGVPVRSLSVQATDKSDRAEGVAALQQAGWRPMADAHKNGEPILALTISQFPGRPDLDHWRNKQIVVHHRGLAPDGFDIGWSMNAPVGHGGFPDDWFVGWAPIPQQTALVEPYSSELDEINGRLA